MRGMRAWSVVLLASVVVCAAAAVRSDRWSEMELAELESLWLGSLESLPADPTNRFADDVLAAAFGQRLFFDVRLSRTGTVSCGSCHRAEREFQDDEPLGRGVGVTDRRTMPIAGTAYSPFLFWDGRKDSQWAQALGPLESAVEHGTTRTAVAHAVASHHRPEYERVFGRLPDLSGVPAEAAPVQDSAAAGAWARLSQKQRDDVTAVFVNVGKAIAAYERRLQFGESRFDRYVAELVQNGRAPAGLLRPDEVAGLRLFIGRANCIQCHNGPLFTNNEFHNTGVPAVAALPQDRGRMNGASAVLKDEFNCRSRWSDAAPSACRELEFITVGAHELERAFKVPSLRNVADRPPYMHAGQIRTLPEVLDHYNRAPGAPSGHSELKPLKLNARQLRQLEAFLRTLSGGTIALSQEEMTAGYENGSEE